jgi:ATP-dependent RNA helicase DeaD
MNTEEQFKELGLSQNLIETLKKKGFEKPTPIQKQAIPVILNEKNGIVAQAPTGTGKTLAFGLPLIDLLEENSNHVQVLILTPTRELAIQVSDEINAFKGNKRIRVSPIYGGQSIELQKRRLASGIDIVVGTPGRVIDHIKRRTLKLDKISYFILDEADEMLNMGFIDDIKEILEATNKEKRMFLFSATIPYEIKQMAKKYIPDHKFMSIQKEEILTSQIYFEVAEADKFEALCRIRDVESDFYGLIFCKTKIDAQNVANKLIERGYFADAIHGDLSQDKRERILTRFRRKQINMLVATDVAARGIDIEGLTHVINYSLPQDPESYIHRIGRTGRAEKEGVAITFVTPSEYRKLSFIQRMAKATMKKEALPSVEQTISIKKEQIKNNLTSMELSQKDENYISFAQEILDDNEPLELVAKLLKLKFKNELNEENYREIREAKVDRNKKQRLFVALGREDGYTIRKLVDFISKKTQTHPNDIREVKIFDKFSFITVPYDEAESILHIFKKSRNGQRSIVTKAKERKR